MDLRSVVTSGKKVRVRIVEAPKSVSIIVTKVFVKSAAPQRFVSIIAVRIVAGTVEDHKYASIAATRVCVRNAGAPKFVCTIVRRGAEGSVGDRRYVSTVE